VGDGGGVEDEWIVVHRVALAEVPGFIAEMRGKGYAVDVKLLLLLAGSILS
jgi:ADP-ribose pyrophosphatase